MLATIYFKGKSTYVLYIYLGGGAMGKIKSFQILGAEMSSCFDVKQGRFNNKTRVMLYTAEAPPILPP